MKFLKIISAILFFSFSGNFQNQLFAQREWPTASLGKWTRVITVGQYLENGDYRAHICEFSNGDFYLEIFTKSFSVVRRRLLGKRPFYSPDPCLKRIYFSHSGNSRVTLLGVMFIAGRDTGFNIDNLETFDESVDSTAYMWLSAEGNLEFYTKNGFLGWGSGRLFMTW